MDPDDPNNPAQRVHALSELVGGMVFWVVLLGLGIAFVVRVLRRSNVRPGVPAGWPVGAAGPSRWHFNPPPGWPPTPPGFVPPAGWHPDPSWPSAPPGWQWWIAS
jgi:hypothetical protein